MPNEITSLSTVWVVKKRGEYKFWGAPLFFSYSPTAAYLQAARANQPGPRVWEPYMITLEEAMMVYKGDEDYNLPTPMLSQRDPAWANLKLGFGPTTIGQYGCVITSLAMMLTTYLASPVNPVDVNQALKSVDGYAGQNANLVIWQKVTEAFPQIKLDNIQYCRTVPAPVDDIDRFIADRKIPIIQVDSSFSQSGIQSHWLPLTGGNQSDGYTAHDPWLIPDEQSPITIPPKYAKPGWDAARAIYAVVYYSPKV